MYESRDRAKLLTKNQMCICRCPDWCDEGYQIAKWNGEAFEYDADPNGGFDQHVIAFLPLNKDGKPTILAVETETVESKDATLKIKLSCDSGYSVEAKARITPSQWGAINGIIHFKTDTICITR